MYCYLVTLDDGSQFEVTGYGWGEVNGLALLILDRDFKGRDIVSVVKKGN